MPDKITKMSTAPYSFYWYFYDHVKAYVREENNDPLRLKWRQPGTMNQGNGDKN